MSTKDDFVRAWKARFPAKNPPNLDCFGNGSPNLDKVSSEKKKCEDRIETLKNELHQQEFISSYLWDIINNPKRPPPVDNGGNDHDDAPLESPPPIPSTNSLSNVDPDLGLDCVVPVQEPRRKGSKRVVVEQVPAYMETDFDFTVQDKHLSQSGYLPENSSLPLSKSDSFTKAPVPGPKVTAPPYVDECKSLDSGLIDKRLKNSTRGQLLKQRSVDTDENKPLWTKGGVSHGSTEAISVSHQTEQTNSARAGNTGPNTGTNSIEEDRTKLTRKFSADSNQPNTFTQPRRDLLESQKRSHSFGGYVEVEIKNPNSSPPAHGGNGSFSTFKPKIASVQPSSSPPSKPVPAPRPSVGPPEFKVKNRLSADPGGLNTIDESSVQVTTGQGRRPSAELAPNGQIPSTFVKPGSQTLPNSISTGASPGNPNGKPQKERPKPPKKSFSKKDVMNFEHKVSSFQNSQRSNSTPPVMVVKDKKVDGKLPQNTVPGSDSVKMSNLDNPVPMNKTPSIDDVIPGPSSPNVDEKIYEEPIPVQKEKIEEASSSDEDEPVYQNLMLLKQHTMSRGPSMVRSGMFASMDFQKKHLNEKAERLSRRFSNSLDTTTSNPARQGGNLLERIGENQELSQTDGSGSDSPNSQHWRKRQSMQFATGDDNTSEDDLDVMVPTCAETEKIQMRKWVVNSIVASERAYLLMLDTLMQYMQTFKNVQDTQQAVIEKDDIGVIFYKIPELHRIHFNFINKLEPKLETWTGEEEIAEQFKLLALEECPLATAYLKNYQKAISTIHKCSQESEQFTALTSSIPCKGISEKYSLEELLHKPVVRFQRNTLVLHDLIKFTPTSHPDYDTLHKTRKIAQNFLETFDSPVDKSNSENQRYLSKQGIVVEKVGTSSQRKLRHILLFNDVFICAKQKISRQRISFDVKWFIPVADLMVVDDRQTANEERQLAENTKHESDKLQKRVSELQNELKEELKKYKKASEGQRTWSFRSHKSNLEKIKKKLYEQEGTLILSSPTLIFKLKSRKTEKSFCLLLASDYERNSWKETISGLQSKPQIPSAMNVEVLTNLLNSIKLPKLTSSGSININDVELEDEALFGSLDVTLHKMYGLKTASDVYCCMEVDSFGHFSLKARTNIISASTEPAWESTFDIELDGAQQLRILCYKLGGETDTLIGKCALELGKGWLRGDFSEETISLGESMTLVVTLKYRNREQTIKRTPSSIQGGLFGVKISTVAKRENSKIPAIVTTCVNEVERRGMDDVGIYRISGLSAEIQSLKKTFEKHTLAAAQMVTQVEINVVTGVLKLYFRELPESLFTDVLYYRLQEGITLSDPEAKEKFMMTQLKSLPEPNLSTVMFMLDHLLRVSEHESKNKMSLHNLSTVFGPTLLRPATKESGPLSMEQLFTAGAQDAMMQTAILYFYLDNWHNKDNLNTRE